MDALSLPERLQAGLLVARKARDEPATTALRTTLAALANAEAPPATATSSVAPPVVGLVEHERLHLTAADHDRILREQIALRVTDAERTSRHWPVARAPRQKWAPRIAVLALFLAAW